MDAAGDLYMGTYQGLYCKGHEAFMKEDELVDGLCPEHKTAPELVKEDNYFFRLSNYQQKLLDFYETHEDFVAPAHRFQEVKSFVEQGLEDISFSREKKEWGSRCRTIRTRSSMFGLMHLLTIFPWSASSDGKTIGGCAYYGEGYHPVPCGDLAGDAHVGGTAATRTDPGARLFHKRRRQDVEDHR